MRHPRMALLGSVLSVGFLGACEVPSGNQGVALADSAGVRITEWSGVAASAPTWSVSETPVLHLPSVGSGYELYRVGSVRPLGTDRLVLSNGGPQELLVFALSGELVRRIGGPGEGPGEFRGLETVFVSPEGALIAADFPQQRVTHFDSGGVLLKTVRLEPQEAFTYVFLRAQLDEGRFMGRMAIAPVRPESLAGLVERPFAMALVDGDGRVGAPIQFGRTQFFLYENEGRLSPLQYPLREIWNLVGQGGRLYASTSRELGVREFDLNGRLLSVTRRADRPLPLSESDWGGVLGGELAHFDEDRATVLRRTYEEMPRPDSWPLSDGLVIDPDGRAWVKHYEMPGHANPVWSVFDLESASLVTEVALPRGLNIQAISGEFIFGTRESELGEESVEVYALRK